RLVPARVTAVDQLRQRVADERPALERRVADERDTNRLGGEAGEAQHEEHAEDERVLWSGLDADAVGPLDVAANERPHDAGDEQDTDRVTEGGVAAVDVAVQELPRRWHLVIDLAGGGDREQAEEAEVDERVHDARRRVA